VIPDSFLEGKGHPLDEGPVGGAGGPRQHRLELRGCVPAAAALLAVQRVLQHRARDARQRPHAQQVVEARVQQPLRSWRTPVRVRQSPGWRALWVWQGQGAAVEVLQRPGCRLRWVQQR
jgi:hypothetical protein